MIGMKMVFNINESTHLLNISEAHNLSHGYPAGNGEQHGSSFYHNDFMDISKIILQYISTPVSVFGIIGNLLTITVLTRRSLKISMMTMERSSHEGLLALSFSDLVFCIAILPMVCMGNPKNNPYFPIYLEKNFDLIYRVYHNAVVNIFLTNSTWLTVMMAAQRYIAICHPIKARQLIDYKYNRLIITLIFFSALFLNIPRFWRYEIISAPCMSLGKVEYCARGPRIYTDLAGALKRHKAKDIYNTVFFFMSILIPLMILTFCNVNLISTLRKSTRLRRDSSNIGLRPDVSDSTQRITLTLIIIILMFIVLVAPGEISNFVWSALYDNTESSAVKQNFTATVLSLLQRINFSFNFILYCVINIHFRRTLLNLFLCKCSSLTNSRTSSATKRSFVNLPTVAQSNRSNSLDPVCLRKSLMNSSSPGISQIMCGKSKMTGEDCRIALLKTKSCDEIEKVTREVMINKL